MSKIRYRLGLDLGTASIGWSVLLLDAKNDPVGIHDSGVRIFSDGRVPKTSEPLAVGRRTARQMRRQRDRKKRRLRKFVNALRKHGLMPNDISERNTLKAHDPWELRSRALDEKLEPYEIGRALFHLMKRRGFKSSRKQDSKDAAKESGAIKSGARRLRTALAEEKKRTIGELLYTRQQAQREEAAKKQTSKHRGCQACRGIRVRRSSAKADEMYDFYPLRAMVREEFHAIWGAQEKFHPESMNDAARDELESIGFHQRPLKPVPRGRCTFHPEEEREAKASLLFQEARIYQNVNHIRIIDRHGESRMLTLSQRDRLVAVLQKKQTITFVSLKKTLKLDPHDDRFNLESEKRKKLEGNSTHAKLALKSYFHHTWAKLSEEKRTEVVDNLLNEEDEEKLVAWLCAEFDFDEPTAEQVAGAHLEQGYGSLGPTALRNVLVELKKEVIPYSEAMARAGYHYSDLWTGERVKELPYYAKILSRHVIPPRGDQAELENGSEEQRYGKIANPTVHMVLNQLRLVVNTLSDAYGAPTQVVVELARDLKHSMKKKEETRKQQRKNQDANEKRRAILQNHNIRPNHDSMLRIRLWEELDPKDALNRVCPFSGKPISFQNLFSGEVQIEHILPFKRTWDDSGANKTLAYRAANQFKGERSPYEAFAKSPGSYDWEAIVSRSRRFPDNKGWRFSPDAMTRFNKEGGVIARQLTDTQYISRLAREYMSHLTPRQNDVWVIPGRLTSQLRYLLGLNSILSVGDFKNRDDHRHHALDAVVIAMTSRSTLQQVATEAGCGLDGWKKNFPVPWANFREDVEGSLAQIVVSHRIDHGKQGRLHEETAYGFVNPDTAIENAEKAQDVVVRKPFDASSIRSEKDVAKIVDGSLRDALTAFVAKFSGDFKEAIMAFPTHESTPVHWQGIRHVRMSRKKTVFPFTDANGRAYKGYCSGSNQCYDIFHVPGEKKWRGEIVSRFEANQPGFEPAWIRECPTARRVMRLRLNDCVSLKIDGERDLFRLVKMTDGKMEFAQIREGGVFQDRHRDKNDPFRWTMKSPGVLRKLSAVLVHVDAMGRVRGYPAESPSESDDSISHDLAEAAE